MTSTLPQPHATFVDRIRRAVEQDARFSALLAGGSLVHGGLDRYSDLDLVLVAENASYDAVMADREAFAAGLGALLAAFTGEHVGEPRLLICLYGPPLLHVDLKFVTGSDLDRRIERPAILFARRPDEIATRLDAARIAWPAKSPDWLEARAWVWLHYAATKLARGELFEAIAMLSWFRDQVLGPMLHRRAGLPQRGVRRIEQLDLDPDGGLAATVAGHDAAAVRAAIGAAIRLYLALRREAPPERPVRGMPEALEPLLGGHGPAVTAPAGRDMERASP